MKTKLLVDIPEIIIKRYREALKKDFGKEIVDESEIRYLGYGWYLVNIARRYPDGSIGAHSELNPQRYRKKQLLEEIKRLEKR